MIATLGARWKLYVLATLLASALAAGCGSSATSKPTRSRASDTIGFSGWSFARWDMTMNEVARRAHATVDCHGSEEIGCPCPVFHPAPKVDFVFSQGRLSVIRAGRGVETTAGVRVGMTVKQVQSTYPRSRLIISGGLDSGLVDLVIASEHGRALVFILGHGRVKAIEAFSQARGFDAEQCG